MKKALKIILRVIFALLGLALLVVIGGALYINATIINIEKKEKDTGGEIKVLTTGDFTFRDLNRNGELDTYEDTRLPVEERVEDLLSRMTPDEKIRLLKGSGMKSGMGLGPSDEGVRGAVGTTVPVSRLGIPALYLSDGPAGLRIHPTRKNDEKTYYCTAFPIGTQLASTWNTELVEQVGKAMGNETLEYGVDVILGPGANIHRNPLCGRNFEYYSEDPMLTGFMGAAMVNGIESNGVGTSVKHFVANNQETNRNLNDVIISERALREIYLKGFEIIVREAQPWTIMSSYNKVNGTYTSESRFLLTDVLRGEWGFEGIVMTDWFGGKNPPAQIRAGNDLLEPGTRQQHKILRKSFKRGELPEEDIDVSVRRILRLILNSRKMEPYSFSNNPDLVSHAEIARHAGSEGMVLLKNDGTLPLKEVKNIALFGVTAYDFIAGGTGSGDVNEAYTVSLEEGLNSAGFEINREAGRLFEAHKAAHAESFRKPRGTFSAMITPYSPPEMVPTAEQAAQVSGSADLAVITIGRNSGEGGDRVKADDFLLSAAEQELIANVCDAFHAAGKKVAVVLNIGGVIETASWKDRPDAILLAWQGGQEGGNSVADILSGKVNPGGKLPMTFPVALEDHASSAHFPMEGTPMNFNTFLSRKEKPAEEQVANVDFTKYEEGIYVGYRHFDKQDLEVSYPFGYGLSYTDFAYKNMELEWIDGALQVTVQVENTGSAAGKEVVQIYVSKPDSPVDRPVRELKTFGKTPLLNSGESAEVTMRIPAEDLSYWDQETPGWLLEEGIYAIEAAASSRDIRLSGEMQL